jgi:hypothetical protein
MRSAILSDAISISTGEGLPPGRSPRSAILRAGLSCVSDPSETANVNVDKGRAGNVYVDIVNQMTSFDRSACAPNGKQMQLSERPSQSFVQLNEIAV